MLPVDIALWLSWPLLKVWLRAKYWVEWAENIWATLVRWWQAEKAMAVEVVRASGITSKVSQVFAKGIKSIDGHIFTEHVFWANNTKSKFLEWANIEALIKEAYSKSGKKFIETTSKDLATWKEFPTIKIEVDMGRKVWTNANGWWDFQIMRIIVDYDGNVVSWYPVWSYQIP